MSLWILVGANVVDLPAGQQTATLSQATISLQPVRVLLCTENALLTGHEYIRVTEQWDPSFTISHKVFCPAWCISYQVVEPLVCVFCWSLFQPTDVCHVIDPSIARAVERLMSIDMVKSYYPIQTVFINVLL